MNQPSVPGFVVALAGRRIDEPGTSNPRFPLANAGVVASRIRKVLEKGVSVLVCSAACGADLLALGVAGELGIRRRVVLPFDRARFRATSVVDRPGEWGERYDRILDEVDAKGDLIELRCDPADPEAYGEANRAMINEAERLAVISSQPALAVAVWERGTPAPWDFTAQFINEAREKEMVIREVGTLAIG